MNDHHASSDCWRFNREFRECESLESHLRVRIKVVENIGQAKKENGEKDHQITTSLD